MATMRRVVLLLLSAGCAGPTSPELVTAPPSATPTPRVLAVAFHVTDTFKLAGPGPIRFAHMSLVDGQLTIVGRQPGAAYPVNIDDITATDYGDSLIVKIAARQGVFTAVSYRDYEARAYGVASQPRWVRVYGCFDLGCYLDADTVLGAPMPGRHPPGW